MRFPRDIEAAILREKQIKSGWRQKKIDLINISIALSLRFIAMTIGVLSLA